MPASPYYVQATATTATNIQITGYCGDPYVKLKFYSSTNGTTFSLAYTWTAIWYKDNNFAYDFTATANTTYWFKVTGESIGGVDSDYSNTAGPRTCWADTVTVYVRGGTSETHTGAVATSDSVTTSVGFSPKSTDVTEYHDTVTASVGFSTSAATSQSIHDNYQYLINTIDGKSHIYSRDYKSDNGTSISSYWLSKITDMSEINPTYMSLWKTIYKIKVKYVDKDASTPLQVGVSLDNVDYTLLPMQTVGVGGGGQMDAYFFTIMTGKYFQFKVEWPSSNKTFQFDGIEVEFTVRGEEFKVN